MVSPFNHVLVKYESEQYAIFTRKMMISIVLVIHFLTRDVLWAKPFWILHISRTWQFSSKVRNKMEAGRRRPGLFMTFAIENHTLWTYLGIMLIIIETGDAYSIRWWICVRGSKESYIPVVQYSISCNIVHACHLFLGKVHVNIYLACNDTPPPPIIGLC